MDNSMPPRNSRSSSSGASDASGGPGPRSATTKATTEQQDNTEEYNDDNDAPPPKKRIRAVVACSHCRSKRSKCDGVPGKKPCTQCCQRGIPCEMSDGKRNRGHYKPQAEALSRQVQLLQQALAEAHAANQALAEVHAANQALERREEQLHELREQHLQQQELHREQHQLQPHFLHHLAFDAQSLLVLPDGDADPALLAPDESIAASTLPPAMAPPSLSPHVYMDPSQNLSAHLFDQNHPSYPHHHHHHPHLSGPGTLLTQHTAPSPAAPLCAPPVPAPAASILTASSPDGGGGGGGGGGGSSSSIGSGAADPLADLTPSSPLVDYLLGLYFHRYQMMMKFVSQRDFMLQHYRDPARSVRSGLFLAMVAAGLRYCTRADVSARFLLRGDGGGGRRPGAEPENLLATAARRAVETELGRPTLATVQTILILGEVETGLGHQMTGYMYCCLASKFIFEMGLDPGSCADRLALCQEETTIRHWLVWSASVQEQYWGIFLRRPVTIKNQTLQMSRMAWRFSEGVCGGVRGGGPGRPSDDDSGPLQPSFEKEVDEELLDLMELAREVTDELYGHGALAAYRGGGAERSGGGGGGSGEEGIVGGGGGGERGGDDGGAGGLPQNHHYPGGGVVRPYVPDLDRLDARLDQWFDSLSDRIRTGPVSGGRDCYHFLFVLHLIFNTTKIVVHRERAALRGGPAAAAASMAAMGAAAVRIAKLFAIFRRREDIRALKTTGVQWAALAAEALVRHIETLPIDGAVEAVAHLQSLQRTLKDMTGSFRSAEDAFAATARAVTTFQRRMDGDEESPGGSRGGGRGRRRPDGLDGLEGLKALEALEGGAGPEIGLTTTTCGMDPPPPPSRQQRRWHHQQHRHRQQMLHPMGPSDAASLASTSTSSHRHHHHPVSIPTTTAEASHYAVFSPSSLVAITAATTTSSNATASATANTIPTGAPRVVPCCDADPVSMASDGWLQSLETTTTTSAAAAAAAVLAKGGGDPLDGRRGSSGGGGGRTRHSLDLGVVQGQGQGQGLQHGGSVTPETTTTLAMQTVPSGPWPEQWERGHHLVGQ